LTNTAQQLLKHRFIRGAGQTEGLQELIERREEWEARRGDRLMKPEMYDNNTVRSTMTGEDDDPWIFATVRPSSANSSMHMSDTDQIGTVKRLPSPPSVHYLITRLIPGTATN
jgi:serine/threonine-protein kinase 24/25/MST4